MLALFGFSTIVLQEYEELFDDSPAQLSSVDIFASHPTIKAVFVVGCTTGSPNEKDFSKLLDVRGVLMNEVFAGRPVRVIPVLVAAAHSGDPYRQIDELNSVAILDRSGLERALEKLQFGREAEFLAFLTNPNVAHYSCAGPPKPGLEAGALTLHIARYPLLGPYPRSLRLAPENQLKGKPVLHFTAQDSGLFL